MIALKVLFFTAAIVIFGACSPKKPGGSSVASPWTPPPRKQPEKTLYTCQNIAGDFRLDSQVSSNDIFVKQIELKQEKDSIRVALHTQENQLISTLTNTGVTDTSDGDSVSSGCESGVVSIQIEKLDGLVFLRLKQEDEQRLRLDYLNEQGLVERSVNFVRVMAMEKPSLIRVN